MGYSVKDSHVRVDVFKQSGSWNNTLVIDMHEEYNAANMKEAIEMLITNQYGKVNMLDNGKLPKGYYSCLEPFHCNAHPVLIIIE